MDIKSIASGRVRGLCLAVALGLTLTTGLCWALVPPEDGSAGTGLRAKEFFLPELYVSSSQRHVDEVLAELPNRVAWENFQAAREQAGKGRLHAFIDPRSGAATNMIDAEPLIPGRGVGNQVTLAELGSRFGYKVRKVGPAEVADAVVDFVGRHRELLGVDMTQLGEVRAVRINRDLWNVNIPQTYHSIPVRHGRLAATLNNGNLVLIGTESWGKVRGLSHVPRISGEDAMEIGFAYADGQSPVDQIVLRPSLEIVPVARENAGIANGYGHRLVWGFHFQRPPEGATWEVLVDAHSGEVVSFQDVNQYATISGGVYPVTSTEICPTAGTCGIMQSDWPMPFADTGLAWPNDCTNSGGIFTGSGSTTTTLSGCYVDVTDYCGPISNSGSPSIDLGGVNGDHDCTSGGGSAGNTAASRTAFYEVNKLMEMARGWLPTNPWLQQTLITRVNINNTCNAYHSGNTINFYRSGGGCRNTGELAGVIDHEWGHVLDYHDTNAVISNPGDAYADIAELYRIQHSCIGYGFWWTYDRGCGMTSDGTGYNANEKQVGGYHCDLDCSGVRDADWDLHEDHNPDTPLNWSCTSCASGTGPCGAQVHCAAVPTSQAAWDFVVRDLQAAPFNLDNQTAFIIGNKLFYQGSGNVGNWHACTCGVSSDGCGATNGYMQWVAADDDDGSISNGTPHMTALYNAFNRHEIACSTPTPTNSGCSGGPTGTATLSADAGDNQVSLSWTAVAGASKYWVFRTEGHAGCDYNKALIAETMLLSYTDGEVANDREYYYNVVAVGTSDGCFGPVSNCVTVTPGGPQCTGDLDCDDGDFCNGAETCNLGTGLCEAGTPVVCDDGVVCTDDSCNESTDSCDYVPNDANCDNGAWCDGAETCNAVLGCQAGTPVVCDDGIACTDDFCNETTDECEYVPNHANCDNGLFCDGAETCDALLDCQAGSDPCPGMRCDEVNDRCIPPCVVDKEGDGSVRLPPRDCYYLSGYEDKHKIIPVLPPEIEIEIYPFHRAFVCDPPENCTQTGGTLGGGKEEFSSELELQMTGTGELDGFERIITLNVDCETHTGPRDSGTFPTKMYRLEGFLTGDEDFDSLHITAGEGFGLPSDGTTMLTDLGDGTVRVESFFDIQYRIEFTGSATGDLSGYSGSNTGIVKMYVGPLPCVVTKEGDGSVRLPPRGCEYVGYEDKHKIIPVPLPPMIEIEIDPIHGAFVCDPPENCSQTGGTLGGGKEEFSSELMLQMTGTGELAEFERTITLNVDCETHTGSRDSGTFPTKMYRLEGLLTGDEDFDSLHITAGEGFGLPSDGTTTLTDLGDGTVRVESSFNIQYRMEFTGSATGELSGYSGSNTGIVKMKTGCADNDFEFGIGGWTTSGTCTTGTFVRGTPTLVIDGGVTTQPDGAHSGANALFTQPNVSAGDDDVDGGECVATSPVYDVTAYSYVLIWYYHGQRDAGDDPTGDYFALEISINGGAWTSLAFYGDVTVNAAWTQTGTVVSAGDTVQLRVRVADGASAGDLIEAGIDDVGICPL